MLIEIKIVIQLGNNVMINVEIMLLLKVNFSKSKKSSIKYEINDICIFD